MYTICTCMQYPGLAIYREIPVFPAQAGNTGKYWEVLGNTGKYWEILGNTGKYWEIPGNTGKYWEIQGNTEKYREIPQDVSMITIKYKCNSHQWS